jgi:hypothetical protein
MLIRTTDYNGAGAMFAGGHAAQWSEIADVLAAVPLHLKGSDQAGKIGKPIWNAVGSNKAIHNAFVRRGWRAYIPIPPQYSYFGKALDFMKSGVTVEVQYSNYPFLLNNLLRCEFFFQHEIKLDVRPIEAVVIITKAKMFDASNSTLYYERGAEQLNALAAIGGFDVPLRLVGLFESYGRGIPVVHTTYSRARHSRTPVKERKTTAHIQVGASASSRAIITVK